MRMQSKIWSVTKVHLCCPESSINWNQPDASVDKTTDGLASSSNSVMDVESDTRCIDVCTIRSVSSGEAYISSSSNPRLRPSEM